MNQNDDIRAMSIDDVEYFLNSNNIKVEMKRFSVDDPNGVLFGTENPKDILITLIMQEYMDNRKFCSRSFISRTLDVIAIKTFEKK